MPIDTPFLIFDLPALDKQVDDTIRSYTEFGAAVQQTSSGFSGDVGTLFQKGDHISKKVSTEVENLPENFPITDESMSILNANMDTYKRQEQRISNEIEKIGDVKLGQLFGSEAAVSSSIAQAIDHQAEKALRQVESAKEDVNKAFTHAIEVADKGAAFIKGTKTQDSGDAGKKGGGGKGWQNVAAFALNLVAKEIKGAKAAVKKLINEIPGEKGGFIGGIFEKLSIGYKERMRKDAEYGEMVNVFQGAVDSGLGKRAQKAVRELWKWSEDAQWYFGVSRQGTQKAAGYLVKSGMESTKAWEKFRDGLGDVGKSAVVTTLALDKHFRIAEGSSMEYSVELMHDYGLSLNDAINSFAKMAFAGQRGAIGTENFVQTVMKAGSAMAPMGINVETVAALASKIVDYYKRMGLSEKYAGNQMTGVVENLFSAFANLDSALKVTIMRDIHNDNTTSGWELLNDYMDGLQRTKMGGNDEFLQKLLGAFSRIVKYQLTGDRSYRILAIKRLLHVGTREAAVVHDFMEVFERLGEAEAVKTKEWEKIRDAFKVERESLNTLDMTRREMISGAAIMGESIMAIMVRLLSMLVVGSKLFKSSVLGYMLHEWKLDPVKRIWEQELELWGQIQGDWDRMIGGAGKVGGAWGREFATALKPTRDVFAEMPTMADWGESPLIKGVGAALSKVRGVVTGVKDIAEDVKDIVGDTAGDIGEIAENVGEFVGQDDHDLVQFAAEKMRQKDLAGETEWAKKNPRKAEDLRRKVEDDFDVDPITGKQLVSREKGQIRVKRPKIKSAGENIVPQALGSASLQVLPQQ